MSLTLDGGGWTMRSRSYINIIELRKPKKAFIFVNNAEHKLALLGVFVSDAYLNLVTFLQTNTQDHYNYHYVCQLTSLVRLGK